MITNITEMNKEKKKRFKKILIELKENLEKQNEKIRVMFMSHNDKLIKAIDDVYSGNIAIETFLKIKDERVKRQKKLLEFLKWKKK